MEHTVRKSLYAMSLMVLFVLVSSCGPKTKIPDSQPLPAGQSWAGVWYSTQFEHMYLRQTGESVNGIYTYKFGGTMEGTANGNLLKFTWVEPGDKNEARRQVKGKGWLQMVREGDLIKLKGEWGYNDAMSGGGVWEAEYVRTMDSEDPRNLDDWKREQGMIE